MNIRLNGLFEPLSWHVDLPPVCGSLRRCAPQMLHDHTLFLELWARMRSDFPTARGAAELRRRFDRSGPHTSTRPLGASRAEVGTRRRWRPKSQPVGAGTDSPTIPFPTRTYLRDNESTSAREVKPRCTRGGGASLARCPVTRRIWAGLIPVPSGSVQARPGSRWRRV
jgi:hypothetical protein